MSNDSGYPSLAALLGLLAVAGFQNRDKLSEWFGGGNRAGSGVDGAPASPRQPDSGGFGNILGPVAGGGLGGLLSGGLGELVNRMRNAGQGEAADSWVSPGANKPVDQSTLGRSLGDDLIEEVSRRTGLSRDELLARLSKALPDAVNQYTPNGRIPRAGDFTG